MTVIAAMPAVELGSVTALDVARVRDQFPILQRPLPDGQRLVYLDNGATTQKPRIVIDKLVEVLEQYNSNAHRSAHTLAGRVNLELEAAREKIARFLGASSADEVIFTSGTTASLNMVASGWGRKFLEPGDEILISEAEHHANLVPWQQAALATGATVRYWPLTADGRLDLTQIERVLTRSTKIVALAGMSNVLGTVHPIDQIAPLARKVGAVIVVDAAQSVPHLPVQVLHPEIDFLAFSGHKIYGPTGIGVLYGRRKLLERIDPFLFGGNMIRSVTCERSEWADLPARLEAGTPAIAEAIALGAAIDFVQELGLVAIHQHEQQLLQQAWDGLQKLDGVTILGPAPEYRGAILSFVVEGVHPQDLGEVLDSRGVAIRVGHHCAMPLHTRLGITASARASFAVYNTAEDVDAFLAAMQAALRLLRRKKK